MNAYDRAAALGIRVPLDGMLCAKQAAVLLDRTPRTLHAWRSDGCGPPFVKRGARFLYPVESLSEWIEG